MTSLSTNNELINPILPEFIDKMDPQFVKIYTKYQAPKMRADQVTIEEYRANPSEYTFQITQGPYPEVGSATIRTIAVEDPPGEIKVQVYYPTANAIKSGGLRAEERLPAHINYHGGGWVIGSLKSDESWCRQACQKAGMILIDVDYRLAPEFPYPTQIWDSWKALQWVFNNAPILGIDSSRVSVGGLSAGGHLAAVMALLAREDPAIPALKLQLLVVPAVDARSAPISGSCDASKVPYESYMTCEHAPCLPLARMRWFTNLWLGIDLEKRPAQASEWLASPILASSHAELAPASIHCAEFDVLRSEGEAYHKILLEAGTPSTLKVYTGVAHPFGHWDGELDTAKEYVQDTIDILRKAHALSNASGR